MKRSAGLLAFLLLLLGGGAASAQSRVTATGTAAILSGDAARARDRAVEAALRTAVEQVIGTLVDSETLVQNNQLLADRIYTQTRGYVSNYSILSENADRDSNIYTVQVEAEVREGSLADDLGGLGLLLRRMKMPRVAVVLKNDDGTVAALVQKVLREKGFLLVETPDEAGGAGFWSMDQGAQSDLLRRYGAEVAILGAASGGAGGSVRGSNLTSYQASVNLKAVKADTREILATASGHGTSVHVGEAGFQEAARQAATVAGGDLVRQITAQWARESSSSRALLLDIDGVTPERAAEVAARLEREARGVQEAILRSSEGARATLHVSMQGDASDLAQEIRKLWPRAKVTSQSANRLTVAF